jgi:hypothetical protein
LGGEESEEKKMRIGTEGKKKKKDTNFSIII